MVVHTLSKWPHQCARSQPLLVDSHWEVASCLHRSGHHHVYWQPLVVLGRSSIAGCTKWLNVFVIAIAILWQHGEQSGDPLYCSQVLPEDFCKEDPCNFPRGGELAMSWPRVGQLMSNSVEKILPWRFRTVFLLPKARTKSGWLEVDQELDMGCQLLGETA